MKLRGPRGFFKTRRLRRSGTGWDEWSPPAGRCEPSVYIRCLGARHPELERDGEILPNLNTCVVP